MFPLLFALFARRKCLGFVSCLLLIEPMEVQAQSSKFTFTRVTNEYRFIARYPTLDAGQVAFAGRGPDGVYGIYTGPIAGPFARVVDNSTLIPGAEAPFNSFFSDVGFEAGRVAFYGGQGEFRGLYLYADGAINRIADRNTLVPFSMKPFDVLNHPPSMDDGIVAFDGQSWTTPGVRPLRGTYLARNGELSRIANTTMPTPGDTRNFSDSFASSIIDGGKIVFIGNRWDRPGIYLHNLNTGVQMRIVDTNTPIPRHGESFRGFGDLGQGLDMDGDMIAFLGSATPVSGVYVANGDSGSLTTIAERGMVIPGTESAPFNGYFDSVSIDAGRVAFGYANLSGTIIGNSVSAASETDFYGIYSNLPGSLSKVLATGDPLDGRIVERAQMGRQGLDVNQILVKVFFEDQSEGIYLATLIPEPGTIALVMSGCAAMAALVRLMPRREREGTRQDGIE